MNSLKKIFLFLSFLSTSISVAQFTDLINSNRPGESMSAYSVGKKIFQSEIGIFKIKEKNDDLNSVANGLGTDLAFRYGVVFEQFELVTNIQYQSDKLMSDSDPINRNGIKKLLIGGKYLLYDPFKNYEEKINLYSWKANHRFKWRQFIPSVSAYAGINLRLTNNPFLELQEPSYSPKVMLITQNQFEGSNVFVTNIFMDKISTQNPVLGYLLTYTKGYGQHWSALLEYKGLNSKAFNDRFFTLGAAYLFDKTMQIDATISSNIKNNPSYLYGGFGFSWRFENNYEEVHISKSDNKKGKKSDKKDKDKDKDKSKKRIDEIPSSNTKP